MGYFALCSLFVRDVLPRPFAAGENTQPPISDWSFFPDFQTNNEGNRSTKGPISLKVDTLHPEMALTNGEIRKDGQTFSLPGEDAGLLDPSTQPPHSWRDFDLEAPQKVVTQPPMAMSAPSATRASDTLVDVEDECTPLLPDVSTHSDQGSPMAIQTGASSMSPMTERRRPQERRSLSVLSFDLSSINDRVSQWTHTMSQWTSTQKNAERIPNEIQYSVFKAPPGITPLKRLPPNGFIYAGTENKYHYDSVVDDCIVAIDIGILPQRISAGSSGSYFIYNTNSEIVGVFKPKDEEPYGPLSPKWTKWIHRNLFPCFFGRSCLIPNLGYICESAASLLDKQLQTYIVPYTDVVEISSESFYYSYWERRSAKRHNRPLRKKQGSFQLFLKGYEEADKFFSKYPLPGSNWLFPPFHQEINPFTDSGASNGTTTADSHFRWTTDTLLQFREELEKLVILDYIMRNTDRGLDNWMIRIDWITTEDGTRLPKLKIGAIDSGLSWPWKHPDEWRSYPFGWLFLPASTIGQPFSEKTRKHFLPLLTSTVWWEECSVLFRELFSQDADFKERMWKKQWAVMKGQAFNVVETLKNPTQGPLELARRTRVMVWDEVMDVPVHVPMSAMFNAIETPIYARQGSAFIGNGPALGPIQEGNTEDGENQAEEHPRDATRASVITTTSDAFDNDGLTFAQDTMATKPVIIERLQQVNSRPPVFTWC